jgi:hypothetical protein
MTANLASRFVLGLTALVVLVVDGLLFYHLYQVPRWGLHYEANSGWVVLVEPNSTAAVAGLRVGDTVTQIGLLPLDRAAAPIDGVLPASLRRGGSRAVIWMMSDGNGPQPWLLAPICAALALWLAGTVIGIGQPGQSSSRRGRLFALFALLAALTLGCATAQDYAAWRWSQWALAPALFATLITYIWLQRALFDGDHQVHGTAFDGALSALALIVLAALLLGPHLFGVASGRGLALLAGLDIVGMLLASHIHMAGRLYAEHSRAIRENVSIAALAGLVAWLPAVILGWLPPMAGLFGVDMRFPLSPYIGSLSLLALAITYPLFVTWSDLSRLESSVRLFAVGLITGGTLVGLAALLVQILDATIHLPDNVRTTIGILLTLVALPIFSPVSRWLQGLAETRLGADDPDYAQGCATMTNDLLLALQISEIVTTLTSLACSCLGLQAIRVWLRTADRTWTLYRHENGTTTQRQEDPPAELVASLGDQPVAPPPGLHEEEQTLSLLCVPVRIHLELRGVLLLARRHPFSGPDSSALETLARQVASALQRVDGVSLRFGQVPHKDQ